MTRNYTPSDTNGHGGKDGPIPVPNATVPYWRSQLHPLDEYRSTEHLSAKCDIAIIGTGMSGVAIAYNLLKLHGRESKPSITLLEARQVCSGATGRNGGHVKMKFDGLAKRMRDYGIEVAEQYATFVNELISGLKRVVEEEKLDCEFELRRTFDVYIDPEDAKQAEQLYYKGVEKGYSWTNDRDFVPESRAEQVWTANDHFVNVYAANLPF